MSFITGVHNFPLDQKIEGQVLAKTEEFGPYHVRILVDSFQGFHDFNLEFYSHGLNLWFLLHVTG
jgi:hypothetical protein